MSEGRVSIFFTGATGYIGGSVLQRLLQHPNRQNFDITALVRNAQKASLLESKFGVKTVVGSLQDLDTLSSLAENAHIIIHTADCDDVDAIKAILGGAKKRHDQTGDVPLLIHTSGTGELVDDARGEYTSEKIYSDLDIPQIEALGPTALHRPVTVLTVEADVAGYVRTHIVLPSIIYGVATGPLFDAGIANPLTIITPRLVSAALNRGSVGVLGKGLTAWGNVHIDDTADLYLHLFDALLSSPEKISHGPDGYFFAENGEHRIIEFLQAIADALFALGRIKTSEVTPYAHEELAKYLGSERFAYLVFTNSRPKAERARRELGWAPKHTKSDFFAGLKSEIEIILQREDAKKHS